MNYLTGLVRCDGCHKKNKKKFCSIFFVSFFLCSATIAALRSVNPAHWQALADQSTSLRGIAYGACVIHAVLYSRQMYGARGLSQYQAFSPVQVNHCMEVIMGSKFKEDGGQAGSESLSELCHLITECKHAATFAVEAISFLMLWSRLHLNLL